jgi:hypothetical protein
MEIPLSEIRMSATRAAERSDGRSSRAALLDGYAFFLNPVSLLKLLWDIIEWLCF